MNAFARWNADSPGEAEECEALDDDVADIKLPPAEAVSRGGGEGVVVVVPALAEGEEGDDGVVAAVVAGAEGTRAPEVAHGVHAPGDVVHEEDADQAAPEEAE